ncbi:MAG TPA: MFS transporter [Candidatus Binataceae bacterium]|nr:MFS transporter [Candidatus Binataceae bacterium]
MSDTVQSESAEAHSEGIVYGRAFWLVFAGTFALNFVLNLFVLFPLWIVERGGSAAAIGAIIGTGSLAALAARPGLGVLIDRRGCRWTAIVFLVLDMFAIALYLPIHSLGAPIYLVRALHGLLEGTARVALFAMVYEMLPRGREGEAMAIFSLSGMVPGALAPLVAELVVNSFGFGAFFAVAIALIAAGAATAYFTPDDRPAPHHVRAAQSGPGYLALGFDRDLLPLWIVTLLFALAIAPRLSFVTPFAYQEGVRRVGIYFLLYSVTAIIARLGGRRLMDRIGLNRMLVPTMATLGVGIAALGLIGTWGMMDTAAIIGGLGHAYLYPALSGLVISRTKIGAMGRSSSVYTSLYDFGAMAGPYMLGILAHAYGYSPMFVVAGGFALLGAAYFALAEPDSIAFGN